MLTKRCNGNIEFNLKAVNNIDIRMMMNITNSRDNEMYRTIASMIDATIHGNRQIENKIKRINKMNITNTRIINTQMIRCRSITSNVTSNM